MSLLRDADSSAGAQRRLSRLSRRPWQRGGEEAFFASRPGPGVGARLGVDFARASAGPLRLQAPPHCAGSKITDDPEGPRHREIVIAQDEKRSGLFSVVWDCALVASGLIMRACPELVLGRAVLELGSGTGLVGISAGYSGAACVVLSDAQASDLLIANAEAAAADCGPIFQVLTYTWGEDLVASGLRRFPPDVVVCSDLLYDAAAAPALLRTLHDLAAASTAAAAAVASGGPDCRNGEGRAGAVEDPQQPLELLMVFKRRDDSIEKPFFEALAESFDLEEILLEEQEERQHSSHCESSGNQEGEGEEQGDVWCGLSERSRRGVHAVIGRARPPRPDGGAAVSCAL